MATLFKLQFLTHNKLILNAQHKQTRDVSWVVPDLSLGYEGTTDNLFCVKQDHWRHIKKQRISASSVHLYGQEIISRGAFDSAKNHKRQRRKRQSVTAKREKSQTPKFV